MWDRFEPEARKVLYRAQEVAKKYEGGCVSTEHLLLGIALEPNCTACTVFKDLGLDSSRIRAQVEMHLVPSEGEEPPEQLLTRQARRVLDLSYDESRSIGCRYVGTEHLLLALIRIDEGVPAAVFARLGVTSERARAAVTARLGGKPGVQRHLRKDLVRASKIFDADPFATMFRTGAFHELLIYTLISHGGPEIEEAIHEVVGEYTVFLVSLGIGLTLTSRHSHMRKQVTIDALLGESMQEAKRHGKSESSSLLLLLALVRTAPPDLSATLEKVGLTYDRLDAAVRQIISFRDRHQS